MPHLRCPSPIHHMSLLARTARLFLYRPKLRTETLALLCSLFFSLCCNQLFWGNVLASQNLSQGAGWLVVSALFVALTALHTLLLLLLLNRLTVKPVLYLLLTATAFAVHFMNSFHVYLDPSMLRNVMATDVHEASDLLTWATFANLLLYAGLPIWFVQRSRLHLDTPGKAIFRRLLAILIAAITAIAAIMLIYQDLASMMRNNREWRYLVTPGNYIYSLGRVAYTATQVAPGPRQPLGADARLGERWQDNKKPRLLVFVLGETARAANWGLSGYSRQTTPELASMSDLINFAPVSTCGSNTEVSVPCMFSPWGRRQYDETRIRNSESLLDVITHAGLKAAWIDNQSGCKGVCDGVGELRPKIAELPQFCDGKVCQDGVLPITLEQLVKTHSDSLFVVMHQMGNHGPAYYKRYPDEFKRYTPACENPDLAKCSRESIVNAYDNAIAYTDHVLADTLRFLKTQKTHDAALIYVSDHGESLGENGLFLHGIPMAIAPDEQTKVPMIMWLSDGFAQKQSVDVQCLARRATQAVTHDNLFHTVLGLLDIVTNVREKEMDLTAGCRNSGGK